MSDVLLIGDPRLRVRAREVGSADVRADVERLHAALAAFRARHGFGRAIAATQLGIPWRFIAMNLGEGPLTLVDPVIEWRSDETFTMWDDCMSFPWLLAKVRRHASVTVRFVDGDGVPRAWERVDAATAELLQHEIDHLDGVLATDRAMALVAREVYFSQPDAVLAQVDRYYEGGRLFNRGES